MRRLTVCLFLALLVAVSLTGGCRPTARTGANERVTTVATIFPLADIAQNIGGDFVETVTLVPPGASPHTFEPTPAQMKEVARANLIIRVGAGLDDWVTGLFATNNAAVHVVAVEAVGTDVLPYVPEEGAGDGEARQPGDAHGHGSSSSTPVDPHVWLDPVLVRDKIAPAIAAALCRIAPQYREEFEANLQKYQGHLTELDGEIRAQLAGLKGASFIALHGAWQYFGRRYHLGDILSVHSSPAKEPSSRWIAALIDACRQAGVKAVLAEPQISPQAVEVIAGETGLPLVVLDPLGGHNVRGRESYLALMRYNARTLAKLTVQSQTEALKR
ncbi:MAG: metal ABC transporter substrate-binding protein [Desulfotomaculales bacterium]